MPITFEARVNLRAKRVTQVCFVAGYLCGAAVITLMPPFCSRNKDPVIRIGLLRFHFLFAEWVHFLAGSIINGDVVLPFSTKDFTRCHRMPRRKYFGLYSEELIGFFLAVMPPSYIMVRTSLQDSYLPYFDLHLLISAGNLVIMLVAIVFRRILWAALVKDRITICEAKQKFTKKSKLVV